MTRRNSRRYDSELMDYMAFSAFTAFALSCRVIGGPQFTSVHGFKWSEKNTENQRRIYRVIIEY